MLSMWACFNLAASAAPGGAADSVCIDAVSYWPLDASQVGQDSQGVPALGTYERVSPDGRFVLRSFSGRKLGEVALIELPLEQHQPMRFYKTPLRNEAFPVQGSWRYLVDVDGRHFRLAEMLQLQLAAQPAFKGGMSGFYAAASELKSQIPGSDGPLIWIRSMSWPQGGRQGQGTGPLQVRTLGLRDSGGQVEVVRDTGAQFICGARNVSDGNVYTLPMISVDGLEFSAIPISPAQGAPSMRVYGLGGQALATQHPCDLRADLQATPGKAVFGFSESGRPAMLAYTHNGSVYFVDRRDEAKGQAFQVEDLKTRVLASAFPGITADGRIVFGATWQTCGPEGACKVQAGYVVADPFQNRDYRQHMASQGAGLPRACVTRGDVRKARSDFAAQHGIPP
ncbi:hypothetical protein [Hydrogenophaga crassostreae]|nr:hypothetical protein [Hydrogenophaga crassostreae]